MMNDHRFFDQYQFLRNMAQDHTAWLASPVGADLSVDGWNVFMAVEPGDFQSALVHFQNSHSYSSGSVISVLQALQTFCHDMAQQGEYELCQALALGMAWLTLEQETSAGRFFNIPLQITNHTAALLLSPTYLAVWAHSYHAGLELHISSDDTLEPSAFRPQRGHLDPHRSLSRKGDGLQFPFQLFVREMARMLLFYDLYPRAIGPTPQENMSTLVHLEACISGLEDVVLSELISVRDDLNLITDMHHHTGTFPEYETFRDQVLQQQHRSDLTRLSLAKFHRSYMQLGRAECHIPNNPIKQQILQAHQLPEEHVQAIYPHFERYIADQHSHVRWARATSVRNRQPAYSAVISLLPADPYCLQKVEESLHPEAWPTPQHLLSYQRLPEIEPESREHSKRLWKWRELLCRIAEMRGYLAQTAGKRVEDVLDELLVTARQVTDHIQDSEITCSTEAEHLARYHSVTEQLNRTLQALPDAEQRVRLEEMINQKSPVTG